MVSDVGLFVAVAMCYPNPKYRERTNRRYIFIYITGYWLYTTLPNPLNCEQPRRLGTPRFLEPQINGPGDAWGLALVRVSTLPAAARAGSVLAWGGGPGEPARRVPGECIYRVPSEPGGPGVFNAAGPGARAMAE